VNERQNIMNPLNCSAAMRELREAFLRSNRTLIAMAHRVKTVVSRRHHGI
jgi:hypothetical protein